MRFLGITALLLLGAWLAAEAPSCMADLPAKSKLDSDDEEEPPVKVAPNAAKKGAKAKSPAAGKGTAAETEPEEQPASKSAPAVADEEEQPITKPAKRVRPPSEKPKTAAVSGPMPIKVCDQLMITHGGSESIISIRLLPFPLRLPLPKEKFQAFALYFEKADAAGIRRIQGKNVHKVEYFEDLVLAQCAEALGVPSESFAQGQSRLKLTDPKVAARALAVVDLLTRAIAEHDSAVQRNLRSDVQWSAALRARLIVAMINLQFSQIDLMIANKKYREAETACDRLRQVLKATDGYDKTLADYYETILLPQGQAALAAGDYAAARDLLVQLESRFPLGLRAAGQKFGEQLSGLARKRLQEAHAAKEKDHRAAAKLLEEAASIWPQLDGLESERRRLEEDYPVLECGYAELPENLSPLLARTPVERHAVALMFESLVRWTDDPRSGAHYEPQLAEGPPVSLARGRQFQLPHCRWSDSSSLRSYPCTVEDVLWTERLLRDKKLPYFSPAWGKLVKKVHHGLDNDPFLAVITLERDYWQPLSLMDFKILPKHCFIGGKDDNEQKIAEEFNRRPVGTGPYRLASSEREADVVRFEANPFYRVAGQPKIREIVFRQFDPLKSVDLLLEDKLQLVYGLRRESVNQLEQQGKGSMIKTLRTPSVWFLAPNYRRAPMKDQNLRLAIAHAIDRETILTQFFRSGRGTNDHAAINGPYPKNSWAYNPAARDYDPKLAPGYAKDALANLGTLPNLQLVYPGNDVEAESACKQIAAQLSALKINLDLVAVPIQQYFTRVVRSHSFDLAYWRHDFADETYWLRSLFDPDAMDPGSANFMGYQPDTIASFFVDLDLHKQFKQVQAITHKVHDEISRTATIIPLWQLDTYVGISSRVQNARLDSRDLFSEPQTWSLAPAR